MRGEDDFEVLRLIEQAVLALQGRIHPGRPAYYAMERLRSEVRRARHEVSAQAPTANAGGA